MPTTKTHRTLCLIANLYPAPRSEIERVLPAAFKVILDRLIPPPKLPSVGEERVRWAEYERTVNRNQSTGV
jgi:hypothetical protein